MGSDATNQKLVHPIVTEKGVTKPAVPSYRPEPLKAGSRVRRRSREDVPVVTSCLLALGCPNARPIGDVPWNNIPDDREFSRNTRNRDSTRKSSLQSRPGCSAKRSPSQLPSNQVLLGERGLGRGRRRPMDRSPGSRPVVQQPRSSSTNAASGAMWASCSCARRAARAPGLLKSLGLSSGSVIR